MSWHFNNYSFDGSIKALGEAVVQATIEMFNSACQNLRPTPAKSHYLFNLRDISRVLQGIMMVKPYEGLKGDAFIRCVPRVEISSCSERPVAPGFEL